MWHWLVYFLGIRPRTPDGAYNFWSGFGSDLGEVAIVGGLAHMARSQNCHVKGCWRIGGHQVEGTPYKTCRKHHPAIDQRVTAEHVAQVHAEANQ